MNYPSAQQNSAATSAGRSYRPSLNGGGSNAASSYRGRSAVGALTTMVVAGISFPTLTHAQNVSGVEATACSRAASQPAVQARIEELRAIALDEDIAIDPASEASIRTFLGRLRSLSRPSIYLLDNGIFRAEWSNLIGEQIVAEFLSDRQVRYVLMGRRASGHLNRAVGTDSVVGFHRQVNAFDLGGLLVA